jgi:hypothetical protein
MTALHNFKRTCTTLSLALGFWKYQSTAIFSPRREEVEELMNEYSVDSDWVSQQWCSKL